MNDRAGGFGLCVILAMGIAACGSNLRATTMSSGKMFPSQPANCEVKFENLGYQDASAKYDAVGLAQLTGADDEPQAWEGKTKEMLSPKVCAMGGTVVTPNAVAGVGTGHGTGIIQFAVWREKAAP